MNVLYVYAGSRDQHLERAILRDIGDQYGPARQVGSHSGEDGLTTVTLAFDEGTVSVQHVAETLRGYRRILDAAEGSFGEGA
ncbi:MAG TPA: hypothetical protein VK943_01950 [Arenibaculum sp.]|nr:hypothetical protein [Arenibaculum sp.]